MEEVFDVKEVADYLHCSQSTIRKLLKNNQIPILFPEGTRTRDGNVGKFYSAGFRKLNESTGLPIVACALDGGWEIRDIKKIMKKKKNGSYRVKVLKIYETN